MAQTPESLIDQFSSKPATLRELVPLRVVGYILPDNGEAETPENARVMAKRWDTGESVEVALRPVQNDRPSIGQFRFDDSSTPVTTEIGGTIVADGAYLDSKLQPLSGHNVAVLNARWLNRVAPSKETGWALVQTARVNEPRMLNPNDPSRGYTQTVTLMQEDKAQVISSLRQLDDQIIDLLDAQARDKTKDWYKRPGSVCAFVRLSQGDLSTNVEVSGGFYQPDDEQYKQPKPRDMVAQDLGQSTFWQSRRQMLERAFSSPDYKVELIPGSTLFVGKKTVQKMMQTQRGPISGMSYDDGEKQRQLFSRMVIGIRRSPRTGQPQALFAQPQVIRQVPSLTGLPNPDELARHQPSGQGAAPQALPQDERTAIAQHNQAPARPQALPHNEKPAAPAPAVTIRKTTQENLLEATATTESGMAFLQKLAPTLNATYDPIAHGMSFPTDKLPVMMSRAKIADLKTAIDQSSFARSPATPAEPAPQEQPPAAPTALPESTPEASGEVDLSSLDLSNLDIDADLEKAYADRQAARGPQR